jgi:protein-S-isoprenylcysteine O-methyltransferase Ste14
MLLLRIYILTGLIVHKLVWEALKREPGNAPRSRSPIPPGIRLVKAVKIGVLLGILVQTLIPPVLPIGDSPIGLTIFGVVLYTAGLALAIAGRVQLGRNWSDIEAGTVQSNHAVVSSGVYRLIRHPIYTGDLLLLFGLELALGSWLVLLVPLLAPVVVRKAVAEERKLLTSIHGYQRYCENTSRFVPVPARIFSRSSR